MKIRKKISFILLLTLGFFKNTHLCQKEIIKTLESDPISIYKDNGNLIFDNDNLIFQIKYTTQIYKEGDLIESEEQITTANSEYKEAYCTSAHQLTSNLNQDSSYYNPVKNLSSHVEDYTDYTIHIKNFAHNSELKKDVEAINKLIGQKEKLTNHIQGIINRGIKISPRYKHYTNIFINRYHLIQMYIKGERSQSEIIKNDFFFENIFEKIKTSEKHIEIILYHYIFTELLANLFKETGKRSTTEHRSTIFY